MWGCRVASSTVVIRFVGDHPTSLSASSGSQVVCESTIIIKLLSVVLDKKTKYYICAASPTDVILFVGDHPTSLSAASVGQVVCASTIII